MALFEGTAGADVLVGGDGDDVLRGLGGDDFLDGGLGSDVFEFGRGDGQDTLNHSPSPDGERDRLQLGAGILLSDLTFTQDGGSLVVGIKGSTDSVRLNGYLNANLADRLDIVLADGTVLGGQAVDRALNAYGDDSLGGTQGADVLLGGAGNDTLVGMEGNDRRPGGGPRLERDGTVLGGQAVDRALNAYGDDSLGGTQGADVLLGGEGNDTLVGMEGDDALYGGTGNDLLDGGAGSDTYHFGRGDGRDTVIDGPSQPGEHNRLQLGTGITLSDVSFTLENGDLVVSLKGSTDSVRITNYFGPGPNERIDIAFADGTVLGGLAVDQAVNAYPGGSSLHGTPGADALIGGAGNGA
ncbi:calcium-binding protein [Rhizobacter sp. Root1221]|uniref:calcium-binding protein n=1 Tax=Rhizobacter sp. Root1221 TaxID=1736433 RepID=UPI0006F4D169|nr:calcium-binding protein [Rhizobacter sp. Root1221]KQV97588.1 hypothetical protein ASC87_23295 [Rhizobacter sp. Root1221]